ncbi:hypothetical protein ZYGR_0I06500 [Zygosaccharomyces rouxii]|uniref:DNA topoisomerase 2 n=1 Tax=Zygosaccharomyces rouxii TaxID=4956 RepID=A0A1Q2ZYG5_ZYGRO|nr:hypothetical protein ZYGR_0I06500 [Zygosaccharomyces rouxii]
MTVDNKSASERYQKITQLEHILKRPDTYIGSVEVQESHQWIYDEESDSMVEKEVSIVPGLFKIFDEILVNAADNKVRDPSMKKIEVNIDSEANSIDVKNDGKGIPIEIHNKENIYIPELIFGHLLTSSNYDDDEKKVTGGRNGFGAKLCNIFSVEFIVETADPGSGNKYVQRWENNMGVCHPPKITSYKKGPSYTKISFKPDLKRFNMETLDNDTLGVMRRRVYDVNGSVRDINVYLNGKSLKIKTFKNYVELYTKSLERKRIAEGLAPEGSDGKSPPILYERVNDCWEIALATSDMSFQQISFVNSIATTTGGTHVNYISDQIVRKITEMLRKQKKTVKAHQVKNLMFLFINCLVENPAFSSQTKEQLTTRVKDFGSQCEISPEFIKKIMKSGLEAKILDLATENAHATLKKSDGTRKNRITDYPKLEDANKAGTREGHKCTLVLTEGDSALSLAVAGLAVVGRDYYGCYPLRGKMLNVREATVDQIQKNAEIQAIKKIMGLQHRKRYEDTKTLRYGHLMIMTDQDHDGSHIKGLIINFLDSSFPGLLNIPGFLVEFITPIVKVTITKPRREVISFYNMPDYEKWRDEESHRYKWKQKYYKGLGTSSGQEARQYFSDLDRHLKRFHALQEGEQDLIDLAFSKKKADDRKEWLRQYEPGTMLDPRLTEIPISDFINKELILFSLADNIRSIPNVLDGFKPGQRKVIYGSFKRNITSEIKISTLANYVAEQTDYHHGPDSLAQTIIGLAQSFVGSNNIYVLNPIGSFGTRATGGKDAAAPRYISTELTKITRKIFHPFDDPLYNYLQEDENTVEPEWYLPILPMLLINGGEGIGTGWSTNIPPFNPLDIVRNLRHLMNGEELEEMHPWFRGWTGTIEKIGPQRYRVYGRIEQTGPCALEITELPARMWTSTLKEHLLLGLGGNDKMKPWIKDLEEQHGNGIRFVVRLTQEEMDKTRVMGFYERFKLISTISLNNMVAFDPHGKIKKYENVSEILTEFYYVRLEYYQKRKDYMSERLQWEVEKLSFQIKFIKLIIEGEMSITNRPRKQIIADLEEKGFPRFNKEGKPSYMKISEKDTEEEEGEKGEDEEEVEGVINGPEEVYGSFEYLLGMKIWALTRERYEKLLKQKQDRQVELETLLQYSAKDLWSMDLDEFVTAYDKFMAEDEEARNGEIPGAATKGKGKRKRKADQDDNEYNPGSKKAKTTKKTPKKVKEEETENFERFLLEPKAIAAPKTKRPSKVKSESEAPLPPSSEESDSKKSNSPPATVKTEPKEEEPEGISAFSSKFKKLSAAFDSPNDAKPNGRAKSPSVIKTEDNDDKKPEPKSTVKSTAARTKRKSPPAKQESESSASDVDEDDEPVAVPQRSMRNRPSRAAAASKKSYQEVIDLSDDSFDDNEEQAPEENADGDEVEDDGASEEDQSYNEDDDDE